MDDLGLVAAIEWHLEEFEKCFGIKAELQTSIEELLIPDLYKIGLFRNRPGIID